MLGDILTVVFAGCGSLGFALVYNLRKKLLWTAFTSSALMAIIFIVLKKFSANMFLINLVCALCATIFSEIMAKILKAPATVLLIPTILPLVPGGLLYYTMYGVVTRNIEMIKTNAEATLETGLGIAVGIVIVSVVFSFGRDKVKQVRKHHYL